MMWQDGRTALMVASGFGRADVVSLLLDNGADADLQDNVSEPWF